jgi:hypothetical protein
MTPKNGTHKALITVGCLGLPKRDKARVDAFCRGLEAALLEMYKPEQPPFAALELVRTAGNARAAAIRGNRRLAAALAGKITLTIEQELTIEQTIARADERRIRAIAALGIAPTLADSGNDWQREYEAERRRQEAALPAAQDTILSFANGSYRNADSTRQAQSSHELKPTDSPNEWGQT